MSANSEYLPPPSSSVDFESLCLDLFRVIWNDPDAQKVGRTGQGQHGVDLYGLQAGRRVGVQCKQTLKDEIPVTVLEAEVVKALRFKPKLDVFLFATTTKRDAKLQAKADELTTTSFEVKVWSWDDLWPELHQRKELLDRLTEIYWPRLGRVEKPPPQKLSPSKLPRTTGELFGRDAELARLEEAWQDRGVHLTSIVAWGGVGKTSLVSRWVADLARRNFDGADYFDWSFYSQGTRDQSTASADAFVDAALRFFGDVAMADSATGAWEKGARLAELVGKRRTLLVLDGLEPLQHPPGPLAGELKDPAIRALLRGLAAKNAGLCVITTRVTLDEELKHYRDGVAQEWILDRLSVTAGVELLRTLGVQGSQAELKATVEEVDGHALTLNLLGRYLVRAHEGDVRKRDRVKLGTATAGHQGGHAFRVMEAYERWFEAEGIQGKQQLAALRLLGLFDRTATAECLALLRKAPKISGLTDALFVSPSGWRKLFQKPVPLGEEIWTVTLSLLAEAGLIETNGGAVDAHPLIREYFARRLQAGLALPSFATTGNNATWREAHGRLFDFLKESTEHRPATLAGLQPLYQAVYHGCQAGRQREACVKVYRDRILRGTGDDGFYSTRKLGAFGADLGAVACFFETPWSRVSPSLTEADQAWLLNQAAFRLRALGRLREALEPTRAGLELRIRQEIWKSAAIIASNLSELELTLGEVAAAVADAKQSVVFADRSGDAFERMARRTTLADARHQAGEEGAALELFREAERLQAEDQPEYPLLYSLQGFQYCDLLLAPAERAAGSGRDARAPSRECDEVERRATQALTWEEQMPGAPLLDFALHHLSLGRARLYRALWEGRDASSFAPAQDEIEKAVAGLHASGEIEFVARGLLTRSWLRFAQGDEPGARADLGEAAEIAERGSMRLHLADVAIYRARFFGDRAALAEARRLVDACGYGRRRAEVAELEATLAPR